MSKAKNKSSLKEDNLQKQQLKIKQESHLYKDGKMNDIFSVLSQQEETITALLNKYQTNTISNEKTESYQDQFSLDDRKNNSNVNKNKIGYKGLQSSEDKSYQEKVRMELLQYKKSKSLSKKKSKSKLVKLQLPIIKANQKNYLLNHQPNRVQLSMVSERGRQKSISGIVHNSDISRQKPISFKKQLQKIYAQNGRRAKYNAKKGHTSRMKSKQSIQYDDEINQDKSRYKINKQTHSNATTLTPQQTQSEQLSIPHPISYYTLPRPPVRQYQQKNDDDSQQEQVPLAYYQRQFKQKIRGQCIQQINYLYFSKNESIKQWSQNLLGMFQKHDKELLALRNKSKYLKKFDDNFFAVDIYKN